MAPRVYSFIKVTNNNDVSDFVIEFTLMRNPKARMSCLKSQLFRYEDNECVGKWRNIWGYFLKDYSFFVAERRLCEDRTDARRYSEEVTERYRNKINKLK